MKRVLLRLVLFCICVATSFFIKTCHYNMEAARVAAAVGDAEPLRYRDFRDALPTKRPNFVPYTIESAMMFAYAKDVADGKGVPAHDPRLAYLPDVAPYAQMNMGLEWVLGWSYRLKCLVFPPAAPSAAELRYQDSPDFAAFTAWNVRLWTAFIPGLIFLWLLALRTPAGLAFAGGMLHAVAASAIARATGQDIVRGDLCIPLILLSMVLAYSFYVRPKRWKLAALFGSTFFCFVTWDLSQLLFAGWAGFEVFRFLCGGRFSGFFRRFFCLFRQGFCRGRNGRLFGGFWLRGDILISKNERSRQNENDQNRHNDFPFILLPKCHIRSTPQQSACCKAFARSRSAGWPWWVQC